MSVFVLVDEMIDQESHPIQLESGGWKKDYTRKFLVIVNSPVTTDNVISFAPGLPKAYDPYSDRNGNILDSMALLVDMQAVFRFPNEDWSQFIVTCKYSTDVNSNTSDKPEFDRPEVEWTSEEVMEAPTSDKSLIKDADGNVIAVGKPYLNSAGQPFTPAPEFPTCNYVLTFTKNELTFDIVTARAFNYKVNDRLFLGVFEPGEVLCLPPTGTLKWQGQLPYFRVKYTFKVKRSILYPTGNGIKSSGTWQPVILDQGLMELREFEDIDENGAFFTDIGPFHIQDNNRAFISNPVCLDGKGKEAKRDPVTKKVKPVWLNFTEFPSANFDDLLEFTRQDIELITGN